MCDYSQEGVPNRRAELLDDLMVEKFPSGTRGFVARSATGVAVCLEPGTELVFREAPLYFSIPTGQVKKAPWATATFFKLDTEAPRMHRDMLRFGDGQVIGIYQLVEGQRARVVQLPAPIKTKIPECASQVLVVCDI